MAETNNVDIASIMNMVASYGRNEQRRHRLHHEYGRHAEPGGERRAQGCHHRARCASASARFGAHAFRLAGPCRHGAYPRLRRLAHRRQCLTADNVADAPATGRRAEASPEEMAARHKRIVAALASELNQPAARIEAVISLIDEGATIPFIARYRKEATGGMDDVALRTLDDRLS